MGKYRKAELMSIINIHTTAKLREVRLAQET